MKLEPKHWAVIAGLITGCATQLLSAQHGWLDITTPGFVAGLMIQVASAITAIFVGAPGASAALDQANKNTDMANATTRAVLSDPIDNGKIDHKRFIGTGAVLLACVLAGSAWNCASLPAKQKAVVALSASETALEAAHDAERALCSPLADKTQPIRHCDGPTAATLGLTDARHQQLATLFARAVQTEIAAAMAVKFWRPGAPPPSTLAEYQRVLADLLGLISATVPATQAVVVKVQAAIDQAAKVAAVLGVQ